jgi:hypothetical protein
MLLLHMQIRRYFNRICDKFMLHTDVYTESSYCSGFHEVASVLIEYVDIRFRLFSAVETSQIFVFKGQEVCLIVVYVVSEKLFTFQKRCRQIRTRDYLIHKNPAYSIRTLATS